MNNDSAPRPSGLIGGPALELVDEATVTAGFAAAARLKSAGWLHAWPMGLWDQHGAVTIPVVVGSIPMPALGQGILITIRSWNWNTDKPRFEVTAHAEDIKVGDLVFGPCNGVTVGSSADGDPPSPQQAVRMLSTRHAPYKVRQGTKGQRRKRHR
jgi:hypothetical protein